MEVALSKIISAKDLEDVLRSLFPELDVRIHSCFSKAGKEGCPIVYEQVQGDYPVFLSFSMLALNNQDWLHLICFEISHEFDCNVWCVDKLYALDNSPYWSVVYEKGIGYMIDDSAYDCENGLKSNDLRFVEKIPADKLTTSVRERLLKLGKL